MSKKHEINKANREENIGGEEVFNMLVRCITNIIFVLSTVAGLKLFISRLGCVIGA